MYDRAAEKLITHIKCFQPTPKNPIRQKKYKRAKLKRAKNSKLKKKKKKTYQY